LTLADWQVCSDILSRGDIGLAEAYIAGRVATEDLTQLLLLAAMNEKAIEEAIHGRWWATMVYRLRHWLRPNTRAGSRKNIHAHYDLGNDFYRLWLDSTMTYSSALFEGDLTRSLADAQSAKYARILRELDAQPGQHILEVGCGWGGFAEHAARAGCRVTGITISAAQLEYAQRRIAAAGLQDRVELKLQDYRSRRSVSVTGPGISACCVTASSPVGALWCRQSPLPKPSSSVTAKAPTLFNSIFFPAACCHRRNVSPGKRPVADWQ
jgi:cyclopropane-fatty-acyl-phospholipid synthase